MKYRLKIIIVITGLFVLMGTACNKHWNEHYNVYPETVDENLWVAMQNDPQLSRFVEVIKSFQLDTLFNSDNSYTVFAPTNDAIASFEAEKSFDTTVVRYHLAAHLINTSGIQGKRQVQTLTSKFALFDNDGGRVKIDGVPVTKESPLYINGRFFTTGEVIEPKPSLYQYFQVTNPVLTNYINTQDTIILDKENSKPLGFDEDGNTVYDTVSITMNKLEMKYFPVKHEFRSLAATIVFPDAEDYNSALDIVADALGDRYTDHKDIPVEWQENILIPYLLSKGIFLNRLEPEEFIWPSPTDTVKFLNMLGDSVVVDYIPVDKAYCSNGYAYNYQHFIIPDSLYSGGTKFEGEDLLKPTGLKYTWKDSVKVETIMALTPEKELVPTASNDTIFKVLFASSDANKDFSLEFTSPPLFPRKYLMVVRTHMDIGGIYDIYVNDQLVKTFDYYDYLLYRGLMFSVIPGVRYLPEGRFNRFDMIVESIQEYGKAKVKFVYKAPGNVLNNGLVIDYIEFKPID